jgi:hypothetical protein
MSKFGELTPKAFYSKHESHRTDYELRAERISKMTLPYLMPVKGTSSSSKMGDSISQSYNGRLIQTLKAKMGMSLLPPSTSSFRLEPDSDVLAQLTAGDANKNAEIAAMLSGTVARVNKEMEAQQIRDKMFDMLLQLIAVGSCVLEKLPKNGMMIHTLRNFVVDLDANGEARAMCILEKKKDLPEGIAPPKEEDEYELYTLIERNNDDQKWHVIQTIGDQEVGEELTYSDKELPYQYIGWTWMDGDYYHRPYAEDYIDDMEQYNTLSNLLLKGSIIAAKSLIFVDQRGNRTKLKDVSESANGDVINGRADDVTAFQLNKNFDFQVPMQRLQDIGKNLASAFLMNESVTRDAERVTAQEIRFMAQELESSSLSGVYSKLAKKVSKRLIEWIMAELNINFSEVGINIITGLDALGRSQEAQKLDSLVQRLTALGMMDYLNESELATRYAAFEAIDTTGLLNTPTQVAQARQQRAQAQTQQTGVDALATSAGTNAGAAIVNGAPQ